MNIGILSAFLLLTKCECPFKFDDPDTFLFFEDRWKDNTLFITEDSGFAEAPTVRRLIRYFDKEIIALQKRP